jgi:hypothetical protein
MECGSGVNRFECVIHTCRSLIESESELKFGVWLIQKALVFPKR